MLSSGVVGVARIVHYEMYEQFLDLDIEAQLNMLTSLSSLLVGPVVIIVLARRGVERIPVGGAPGPWGGGGAWGAQQPGYPPPQAAPGQRPCGPRLRAPALLPAAPLVSGAAGRRGRTDRGCRAPLRLRSSPATA